MQTIFLLLASIASQIAAHDAPFVADQVDTIAIAHCADGSTLVFFLGFIQGEWDVVDHRWLSADMSPGRDGDRWTLAWYDDGDSCYRLIRATHWIESWERESPLAVINNRPWFARLCAPGLAKAPRGPQ